MTGRQPPGTLYVVGTPIGNLGDVTDRAREVLGAVDVIAAEDTRRTGTLLARLGVERPRFVSLFEGNERERTVELVEELRRGRSVALVSDAGMPAVSDPGFRLVRASAEAGIDVRVVPFESPLLDASALCRGAARWDPDLVVSVGTFEDDLAVARERATLPERTVLALVAAGLAAFGDELGALAEGIIGPSQWEPAAGDTPLLGPDSDSFIGAFEEAFRRPPEYPAAQAFAIGLILMECRRRCGGSLDDAALLDAARALETTTFYGGFRLDPWTGRQVGHGIRLVRWQDGRKRLVD